MADISKFTKIADRVDAAMMELANRVLNKWTVLPIMLCIVIYVAMRNLAEWLYVRSITAWESLTEEGSWW